LLRLITGVVGGYGDLPYLAFTNHGVGTGGLVQSEAGGDGAFPQSSVAVVLAWLLAH
jgi:hypothetical protein